MLVYRKGQAEMYKNVRWTRIMKGRQKRIEKGTQTDADIK